MTSLKFPEAGTAEGETSGTQNIKNHTVVVNAEIEFPREKKKFGKINENNY